MKFNKLLLLVTIIFSAKILPAQKQGEYYRAVSTFTAQLFSNSACQTKPHQVNRKTLFKVVEVEGSHVKILIRAHAKSYRKDTAAAEKNALLAEEQANAARQKVQLAKENKKAHKLSKKSTKADTIAAEKAKAELKEAMAAVKKAEEVLKKAKGMAEDQKITPEERSSVAKGFVYCVPKSMFIPSNVLSRNDSTLDTTTALSTTKWLKDATTFTFERPNDRTYFKHTVNGLRIVFEPQVGTIFQAGENKIEVPNIGSLGKIGLETNLFKGYVALQCLLIYPSKVQYDEKSRYRTKGYTTDSLGWVGVNVGFSMGLSFFDGILAVGYAGLFFDKRDFKPVEERLVYQSNFIYFNVQVISAIKAVAKKL